MRQALCYYDLVSVIMSSCGKDMTVHVVIASNTHRDTYVSVMGATVPALNL